MFKYRKGIILIIFLFMAYWNSHASVMGSDMSWTCLGNDSFLIRLNLYNDCGGSAPGSINIDFRCQTTGSLITTLNLSAPTPVDITPVCITSCSRCQSSTCSFPYGIHKYAYQGIVKLSSAGSCCNLILSTNIGTRSSSISTGAAGKGFYNEAMMNRCLNPCDNSPVFANNPVQILCVGANTVYNHGLKDYDTTSSGALSDSITYEWTQPKSDTITNISYTGSYAYNKPIYFWGFPNDALVFPRGMHLDSRSGDVMFRPMKAEVTVMVVKANVFRNGVKIAELKRDLEFRVITCTNNNPPLLSTTNNVVSKTVCEGQTVSFNFSTTDINVSDTVTLGWSNTIPGATWSTTNGLTKTPTATLTWTPGFTRGSNLPYTFTVTAKDNSCALTGNVTQTYEIFVKHSPEATITTADSGCGTFWFFANPKVGSNPYYTWQSQNFSFTPDTGTRVYANFNPGTHPYSMNMTASGCTTIYNKSLVVPNYMVLTLPADTTVCLNSIITVKAKITNAPGIYTLQWGSGSTAFAGNTLSVKTLKISRDTTLWIRGTYASFNCPYDEITIRVQPSPLILPNDSFFCQLNNLLPAVSIDDLDAVVSYKWHKQGSTAIVDTDAYLNLFDTGTYVCDIIDTFGCPFADVSKTHLNPVVTASANDAAICSGDQAVLVADSFSGHNYHYTWWLNNSLLSSSRQFVTSPADTTIYTLKVTEFLNGIYCSDSHIVTLDVKPLPVLKFKPFDLACEYNGPVLLNNYVTANGQNADIGIWKCIDNPSLIDTNTFITTNAPMKLNPGYKLSFEYTDPITTCLNSDTTYLDVHPRPAKPDIIILGDTSFCFGDSVQLSSSDTFAGYAWSTGESTNFIVVKNSGNYRLVGLNSVGCGSDSSDPAEVLVFPKPARPVITVSSSDSLMECDQMNGHYEWFYRSDTLPDLIPVNLDSRRINPKNYCNHCFFVLIFTDVNGCVSDTSAVYYFINLSINLDQRITGFDLYPNPAHHQLFIINPTNNTVELLISDIFGRILGNHQILPGKNNLDISFLDQGIYMFRLNNSKVFRLVVE